ncbi:MAG: F0F1 ATP synthase subunit A [Armatimonadetes bacterium]|nr:F0F1 ATP synthase subunit A [Armatimonadota bacterium]
MEEPKTWLHFLVAKNILPKWMPEMVPVTWLIILILCGTAIFMRGRLKLRNPGRFQLFMEFSVDALQGFVRNLVGEREARSVTPVIGTFFIFILALNLFGLIPGFLAPTANTNTTVALALFAFVYVQYVSITRVGLWNYFKHFLGEPLWLSPLMLPLHVIGELARPLSLSVRLFGNIFGEDLVILVIIMIGASVMKNLFWVPIQFPMMLFGIFTGFVQALVFSMLVGIYISVGISGHDESH